MRAVKAVDKRCPFRELRYWKLATQKSTASVATCAKTISQLLRVSAPQVRCYEYLPHKTCKSQTWHHLRAAVICRQYTKAYRLRSPYCISNKQKTLSCCCRYKRLYSQTLRSACITDAHQAPTSFLLPFVCWKQTSYCVQPSNSIANGAVREVCPNRTVWVGWADKEYLTPCWLAQNL